MRRHIVIPDTQCKPGIDLGYLERIGRYCVDMRPDVIVHLGDHADMPSLSSYDKGKKSFEGRRYRRDVDAARAGMEALLAPIRTEQARLVRNKERSWKPELHLTLGNHEHRITRAVEAQAEYDGLITVDDLCYAQSGWSVHPFLTPTVIDGVVYCHYLTSGVMGRPITTAGALISKKHQSCIVGHQQGRQVAYATRADGKMITAIIAGSAYEHAEDYMGPQGNEHWRGIIVLNEVNNGQFDEMFVSLDYLRRAYAK